MADKTDVRPTSAKNPTFLQRSSCRRGRICPLSTVDGYGNCTRTHQRIG